MGIASGVMILILSGVLNGSFAAPIKKISGWRWENTWFVYALFALIVLPLFVTVIFIPHGLSVYSGVSFREMFTVFLFGMGWGIGSVMFGLAIALLGFSLGYTIVVSGIAAFGSIIPFLLSSEKSIFSKEGIPLLLSLLCLTLGSYLCTNVTKSKSSNTLRNGLTKQTKNNLVFGICISILAAILSSMLNLAFHFGTPITIAAKQKFPNFSQFQINQILWNIILIAGFIPFLIYCTFRTLKNKSFGNFSGQLSLSNWVYAILMGIIWFSCIVLYGLGLDRIPEISGSFGWVILMTVTVVVGNIWGMITGEWKGYTLKSKVIRVFGIFILLSNIVFIGLL